MPNLFRQFTGLYASLFGLVSIASEPLRIGQTKLGGVKGKLMLKALSVVKKSIAPSLLCSVVAIFATPNSSASNHQNSSSPEQNSAAASEISGPYFNHDESVSYIEPYRKIQRAGSDLEALILAEIQSAQTSLDIAAQELRLPRVAHALVAKQKNGVRVRLIIENDYNYTVSELKEGRGRNDEEQGTRHVLEYVRFVDMNQDGILSDHEIKQRDAMAIIRNAKIPLIDDTADATKGSSLMHHKFLIADGERLLVTSANFTMSDIHGDITSPASRGNANALLVFENATLVQQYQREFDILWGSSAISQNSAKPRFGVHKPYRGVVRADLGGKSSATVQFSPTPRGLGFESSTSGLIDRSLQRAQKSVDMALFVFSEQRFSNTLQKLTERFPLNIKVLVEATFAYQWYSEIIDMLGLKLLSPSCLKDINNSPWKKPIRSVGVPTLENGDFLHHKFAVIDSKTTIFGSQNWSNAANDKNDDNLLVIEDAEVAKKFTTEFKRLYRTARVGVPETLTRNIKEREEMCGK